MTWIKAQNLSAGDMIDLEAVYKDYDVFVEATDLSRYEFAQVEEVEFETAGTADGSDAIIIHTDQRSIAVHVDYKVEVQA